ncbi:MAG: hypothetical protein KJ970_03255, partial [Candidatus Eisenbacteria bacterium]|nr:hypothetical protein [Candidatus Eisenbacteria bacterium]
YIVRAKAIRPAFTVSITDGPALLTAKERQRQSADRRLWNAKNESEIIVNSNGKLPNCCASPLSTHPGCRNPVKQQKGEANELIP